MNTFEVLYTDVFNQESLMFPTNAGHAEWTTGGHAGRTDKIIEAMKVMSKILTSAMKEREAFLRALGVSLAMQEEVMDGIDKVRAFDVIHFHSFLLLLPA